MGITLGFGNKHYKLSHLQIYKLDMLIYEFYDVLIDGSILCYTYTISTNSTQGSLGDGFYILSLLFCSCRPND